METVGVVGTTELEEGMGFFAMVPVGEICTTLLENDFEIESLGSCNVCEGVELLLGGACREPVNRVCYSV